MSDFHAKKIKAAHQRKRRAHLRIRRRLSGTAERPRLSVFKSLRFTYAQVIDDSTGHTLVQANSAETGIGADGKGSTASCKTARAVGELLAERAKEKGIQKVVFDRGGNIYHGRVKAIADGARSKGLEF